MTLKLREAGAFTWPEWADCLAHEIQCAQAAGDPDLGDTYYLHWLAALERIVAEKGLIGAADLAERKTEWADGDGRPPTGIAREATELAEVALLRVCWSATTGTCLKRLAPFQS
jgi:nitrile hydratase accessory protein